MSLARTSAVLACVAAAFWGCSSAGPQPGHSGWISHPDDSGGGSSSSGGPSDDACAFCSPTPGDDGGGAAPSGGDTGTTAMTGDDGSAAGSPETGAPLMFPPISLPDSGSSSSDGGACTTKICVDPVFDCPLQGCFNGCVNFFCK